MPEMIRSKWQRLSSASAATLSDAVSIRLNCAASPFCSELRIPGSLSTMRAELRRFGTAASFTIRQDGFGKCGAEILGRTSHGCRKPFIVVIGRRLTCKLLHHGKETEITNRFPEAGSRNALQWANVSEILINSATNCRARPIPSLGQKTRNQRGINAPPSRAGPRLLRDCKKKVCWHLNCMCPGCCGIHKEHRKNRSVLMIEKGTCRN